MTTRPADPGSAIDQPVTEACDGIVFRAVVSFVAVTAIAAVPLLLHLPPGIHEAAHSVLPGVWIIYAVVVLVRLRGVPDPPGDPWRQASAADADAARPAHIAYVLLPVGWLAAAAGLLIHHLSSASGTAAVLGIDVPILAIAWFSALTAWRANCRAVLSSAEQARDQRLRRHLEGLRGSH